MALETFQRKSLNGSTVVYQSPQSTLAEPELVIFKITGTEGQSFRANIKVAKGDVDANGVPRVQKTLLERELRFPVENNPGDIAHAEAIMAGVVAHATVLNTLNTGVIPQDLSIQFDITRPPI